MIFKKPFLLAYCHHSQHVMTAVLTNFNVCEIAKINKVESLAYTVLKKIQGKTKDVVGVKTTAYYPANLRTNVCFQTDS